MLVYWEQNVGGVQAENSNTEEENKDCEIQQPHMKSTKDEEHMEDLVISTILIFDLQMTNKSVSINYKSGGFGMQKFIDDLLGVLVESIIIFAQYSRVFAQSSYLLAQLTKKLV